MSEFKKIFEAYGGDYNTTMARFINNKRMYMKFLDKFFEDESMNKLGSALGDNDLKGAFEAAHTLKGVAGNMGLTPLFDKVCAIVEPLRSCDEQAGYTDLYQEIKCEFVRADELRAALKREAQL